jgi:hypothetical protein
MTCCAQGPGSRLLCRLQGDARPHPQARGGCQRFVSGALLILAAVCDTNNIHTSVTYRATGFDD